MLDIDNHQNQKNTFGIKVRLTEDLKSKLNMKKSKEDSVVYWFYTILPSDRNEWVAKVKQGLRGNIYFSVFLCKFLCCSYHGNA